MKILRLRLSNLNSLRGPSAIDFTTAPLAGAGLFAITGPTGAGKTTLLDAITLALYGRVARYGSAPNPDAVMSRHTGECSAEVEFTCAAGMFRSTWHLARARKRPDGNVQPAKRRVIALPAESVVAESIKESDAAILELTGLDYERFLRSVLLAQGEFAAFLQAGPKERTELLQEVTGTAIYQDISRAAYRRAAEAEQNHVTILGENQAVKVLAEPERTQLAAKKMQSTHRISELTAILQDRMKRVTDAERWLELDRSAAQLMADQTHHAASRRDAEADLNRLARHEQAAPFVPAITSLDLLAVAQQNDTTALKELEGKQPELVHRLQAAETAVTESQTALQGAEGRQTALRALWAEVTELDQALASAREAFRQISEQHVGLAKEVTLLTQTLEAESTTLRQLTSSHDEISAWLAEHAIDARLSDQLPELQAAFERWSAADQSAVAAQRTVESQQQEAGRFASLIKALEEQLPPLQRELDIVTIATKEAERAHLAAVGQSTLAQMETRRDQMRESRLTLEKTLADAARLRTLTADLADRKNEAGDRGLAITTSVEKRQLRQEHQSAMIQRLSAERNALRYAEQLQSLAGQRRELQENKPCPLCGALHHPYVSDGLPDDELAAIRVRVTEAEKSQEEAQRQLTEIDKRHAALLAEKKALAAEIDRRTHELSALIAEWNKVADSYGLGNQFASVQVLGTCLVEARAAEDLSSAQVAAVRAAEVQWQNTKDAQQGAQKTLDRVKADVTQQRALATHVEKQLPILTAALREHVASTASQRARFAALVSDFAAGPSRLAEAPALLALLKVRHAAYAKRQGELHVLAGSRGRQATKSEAIMQQLAARKIAAQETLARLNSAQEDVARREFSRREIFGQRTVNEARAEEEAGLERARNIAATRRDEAAKLRQEHASVRQEINRLTHILGHRDTEQKVAVDRLKADSRSAGFPDETAVRSAILPAADTEGLLRVRTLLDEKRVALTALEENLARQKALLPAASEDSANLAVLKAELAAGETERAELQITLGEVAAILRNDDEQRARQLILAEQVEAAHRDFVRWAALRALIGSADGSVFARFAQGLTLERLTVLANQHLKSLNPRYSMRRTDNEAGDLELEIIDHYQAEVARPMRSLSGGESFLASLALALGLSELASGRTSIESLFIDEGFGSLDADTLEIAMSALENLQARGKTVGVISHVAAMQERIPTQIQVIKGAGGCSSLALAS